MAWEFKSGIPIYLQIVETLKTEIASGKLRAGDPIRTVRDLAVEAGVNPNTMQRALAQMEQEGILYTVRASGRFVTKDEERIRKMRIQLAEEEVRSLYRHLTGIGLSREEIIRSVQNWKEEEG